MDKSPDAFRTISEVADYLETPAHVLRFWESRFPQIRPVKRAGGRRYYRPADVALLTGIKQLLHDEGLTIRGVQKMLREQGVRHVAGLSGEHFPDDADLDAEAALEAALAANFGLLDEDEYTAMPAHKAEPATATIFALETAVRRTPIAPKPEPAPLQPEFSFDLQDTDIIPESENNTHDAFGLDTDSTDETLVSESAFAIVPETEMPAPALKIPDVVISAETVETTITVEAVEAVEAVSTPAPTDKCENTQPATSLAARLRALPTAAFHSNPEAALLRDRLKALHARMTAPL